MKSKIDRSDVEVLLYARYPDPGRVKTRLMSALGAEGAARLYRAFLLDMIESLHDSFSDNLAIAIDESSNLGRMVTMLTEEQSGDRLSIRIEAQSGGDLGERLSTSFASRWARGEGPLIIVGSDHPTLPSRYLEKGSLLLAEKDVVLGPAEDGGFYAVGLGRNVEGLFDDLPWSTPELFDSIRRRISEKGLSLGLLPEWYDVDLPGDLQRLLADVRGRQAYHRIEEVLRNLGVTSDG